MGSHASFSFSEQNMRPASVCLFSGSFAAGYCHRLSSPLSFKHFSLPSRITSRPSLVSSSSSPSFSSRGSSSSLKSRSLSSTPPASNLGPWYSHDPSKSYTARALEKTNTQKNHTQEKNKNHHEEDEPLLGGLDVKDVEQPQQTQTQTKRPRSPSQSNATNT